MGWVLILACGKEGHFWEKPGTLANLGDLEKKGT